MWDFSFWYMFIIFQLFKFLFWIYSSNRFDHSSFHANMYLVPPAEPFLQLSLKRPHLQMDCWPHDQLHHNSLDSHLFVWWAAPKYSRGRVKISIHELFWKTNRRNSTHEWGLGTVASFGWTPDFLFLYDGLGPWLQITRCEYSIECYAKQMNHCRNCEHDRPSLFWLPIKIEINVRYSYWLNKFNWVLIQRDDKFCRLNLDFFLRNFNSPPAISEMM